ncbi:MAG: MoaD/ThiS family protein [Candidatus Heimdallarchaeota archaeon]
MNVSFDFKGSIFNQKEKITLELPEQTTLLKALQQVCKQYPHISNLLFKDGAIRADLLIMVDQKDAKRLHLFDVPLKPNQVVTILPLAHGG